MLSLSARIRQERERRRWSQIELARRIGVSESTIRRWESGERTPHPFYRYKLHAVLGIPYGAREQRAERIRRMDGQRADTYFVFDAQEQEYLRLHAQAEMVSRKLGGIMPEQTRPGRFHGVLDVACGTGDWLIACARAYRQMQTLIGIDINAKTLAFAQVQAERAHVAERVQFAQMDALRALDYPDETFDLVNLRFGISWVRTWDWPRVLSEMRRVLRPGGVVRLVEQHYIQSNGNALQRFFSLGTQAATQAGYLTVLDLADPAKGHAHLLAQSSFTGIESRMVRPMYHPGGDEYPLFAQDIRHLLEHSGPFVQKWITVDDYQQLVEQIHAELDGPDFAATWPIETVWATK